MSAAHRTEAACLLEQGAQYPTRIGLMPRGSGDPILAGIRRGGFSLYFGDAPFFHFDLEGRWQRAIIDQTHYLKGLDGAVHALDRIREGASLVLRRRRLGDSESADLDATIRATSLDLLGRLDRDELIPLNPGERGRPLELDRLCDFLRRISDWDAPLWLAHRERFRATYGSLEFLPPEGSGAVVIQAVVDDGKNLEAFERHLGDVAALWGRRLLQARLLYLAGPLVLKQPHRVVEEWLEATARIFPMGPAADDESPRFNGVHAFLCDFATPRPDQAAWTRYHELGLSRVSLDVVSGDPAVRSNHGRTWADHELIQTIAGLKGAGLGASVLLLVGAAGRAHAEAHRQGTVRLLESLALGKGDIVFLLDERELPRLDNPPDPIAGDEWLELQQSLKDALAPLKKRGVKVVPYTMEKQWS